MFDFERGWRHFLETGHCYQNCFGGTLAIGSVHLQYIACRLSVQTKAYGYGKIAIGTFNIPKPDAAQSACRGCLNTAMYLDAEACSLLNITTGFYFHCCSSHRGLQLCKEFIVFYVNTTAMI